MRGSPLRINSCLGEIMNQRFGRSGEASSIKNVRLAAARPTLRGAVPLYRRIIHH